MSLASFCQSLAVLNPTFMTTIHLYAIVHLSFNEMPAYGFVARGNYAALFQVLPPPLTYCLFAVVAQGWSDKGGKMLSRRTSPEEGGGDSQHFFFLLHKKKSSVNMTICCVLPLVQRTIFPKNFSTCILTSTSKSLFWALYIFYFLVDKNKYTYKYVSQKLQLKC